MEKSSQKTALLAFMGLVMAAVLGVGGWVVIRVVTKPGPRQVAMAREEARKKAMSDKEIEIEKLKNKYAELAGKLEEMPPFKPPQDGIISPDQMRRYVSVLNTTVMTVQAEEKKMPEGKKSIPEAFFIANHILLTTQISQATNMIDNMMTYQEYEWLEKKVQEACLQTLLRLEKATKDPEQAKNVRKYASDFAIILGYHTSDENGEFIGHPEQMDPGLVPEQHINYVIQYHDKLGFPNVWINTLDWTPLTQNGGAQPQ